MDANVLFITKVLMLIHNPLCLNITYHSPIYYLELKYTLIKKSKVRNKDDSLS